MSEDGNFTPAHWGGGGHDFKDAYSAYDQYAGRSYETAKLKQKDRKDLLPAELTTNSSAPLVIVTDQTGSMDEWPKIMFSKLPYLELEACEYLGRDMEISWCAVGDAQKGEDYPVQGRPFTHGTDLKTKLMEIVLEGKGGGGGNETYELMALYLARNVRMPRAIRRPICILIGDEIPYDMISPELAATYARVKLSQPISTHEVFEELRRKFSTYIIRKPYYTSNGDSMSSFDKKAIDLWAQLLGGADHVAFLPQPERVVDVIFGILAKETGRVGYFREELEQRQLPDAGGDAKVKTVYKSLKTVHALPPPKAGGSANLSKTHGLGGGTPTKPLME